MQIAAIRSDIISQLNDLGKFRSVKPWQGDIEKLLGQPKAPMSAFVAVAGGRFQAPKMMPPGAARSDLMWDVILFLPQGDEDSTLEAVCSSADSGGLTGLKPATGGLLWPVEFELVASSGLANAYRVTFEIENMN